MSKRFGTTFDADRFIHIYSSDENMKDDDHKFGLVQFDKLTGKEVGWLWLNERNPEYTLDIVTHTVYFKSSEKVIQALTFDTVPGFTPENPSEN